MSIDPRDEAEIEASHDADADRENDDGSQVVVPVNDGVHGEAVVGVTELVREHVEESVPGDELPVGPQNFDV